MPRPVDIKGKGKGRASSRMTEETYVFNDFANLSLADKHVPGLSRRAGDYYSSSEPKYETRSGRTYAQAPPPKYHGPHFETSPAQEELWNSRGSKDVWDSLGPQRSVAPRPETHGRTHSFHESTRKPIYSEPYEKRTQPVWRPITIFTPSMRAKMFSEKQ